MAIIIREAETQDIEQLIEARIAFISAVRGAAWVAAHIPNLEGFKTLQREFLTEYLNQGGFFGVVAEDDNVIVGTAFASLSRSLPKPNNRSGLTAKIVSVYTAEAYQGQGIARQVLEYLIEQLQQLGVGRVELEYTDIAFKVYERLGFEEMTHHMELNL